MRRLPLPCVTKWISGLPYPAHLGLAVCEYQKLFLVLCTCPCSMFSACCQMVRKLRDAAKYRLLRCLRFVFRYCVPISTRTLLWASARSAGRPKSLRATLDLPWSLDRISPAFYYFPMRRSSLFYRKVVMFLYIIKFWVLVMVYLKWNKFPVVYP